MRGLPGSGKSTWAKQLVTENPNSYKRINRDELRQMFDNGYVSNGNEKFIKQVRDMLILKALSDGKHVIVDDTNLSEKSLVRIRQLVQEFNKEHKDEVLVEVQMMETSISECIERDEARAKPVGENVIRRMHRQFLDAAMMYNEQDASLPKAILCDLDGTLALLNGRDPYNASGCDADLLNTPVANVLRNYKQFGYQVILVSGREDTYKEPTLRFLEQHAIVYDQLLMRAAGDGRKDAIIKRELFDREIAGKYYIEFILDDRNQVVQMWRDDLKLPCFQVYYGDF
ncbi:putative kinase [Taibaiella chishuiensis]|uniref:Putative kinase n=2 Tax=Taibaiella chishuiensis TaxID=1434707 RepID=A0A2P8DAW2_9BACT|nr:putative kinase [Taibaiella chishuiensis]